MLGKLRLFICKLVIKLGFAKTAYYINGSETLPAPLSTEQEQELIKMFRSNEKEVKEKLIVHNLRLVVYIARKFDNNLYNVEDLMAMIL